MGGSDLDILIHDEVQLIDWGESRSTGPWVKLRLADIQQLEVFRGLDTATAKKTGHIFNMTLSQGDILSASTESEADPAPARPYGEQARQLKLSSFFRTPAVWKAIGSDAEYNKWVQHQPCIVCGDGDWLDGERLCESAHVRRTPDSGTAHKGKYATVPMCHKHHAIQHNPGESAAFRQHLIIKYGRERQVHEQEARDWFDKQRIEHVQRWGWETLKEQLGFESWADVPLSYLDDWAIQHDVHAYLPECYKVSVEF